MLQYTLKRKKKRRRWGRGGGKKEEQKLVLIFKNNYLTKIFSVLLEDSLFFLSFTDLSLQNTLAIHRLNL